MDLDLLPVSLEDTCYWPTPTWLSTGPTKLARTKPSLIYVPVPGLSDGGEELKTGWPGKYTSDLVVIEFSSASAYDGSWSGSLYWYLVYCSSTVHED